MDSINQGRPLVKTGIRGESKFPWSHPQLSWGRLDRTQLSSQVELDLTWQWWSNKSSTLKRARSLCSWASNMCVCGEGCVFVLKSYDCGARANQMGVCWCLPWRSQLNIGTPPDDDGSNDYLNVEGTPIFTPGMNLRIFRWSHTLGNLHLLLLFNQGWLEVMFISATLKVMNSTAPLTSEVEID